MPPGPAEPRAPSRAAAPARRSSPAAQFDRGGPAPPRGRNRSRRSYVRCRAARSQRARGRGAIARRNRAEPSGRADFIRVPSPAASTTTAMGRLGFGEYAAVAVPWDGSVTQRPSQGERSGWVTGIASLSRRLVRPVNEPLPAAGGLGLEPRLQGSKGLRAADYPIPHRDVPAYRRPARRLMRRDRRLVSLASYAAVSYGGVS